MYAVYLTGMRGVYVLYGLGMVILVLGAWYAFDRSAAKRHVINLPPSTVSMSTLSLTLTSPAFEHGGKIPAHYTCDGTRTLSPALVWSVVPDGTVSLVLIMDDPDVPKAIKPDGVFDHWTLFNISPTTTEIPEGGSVGSAGVNGAGSNAYTGPCPPPQYEPSEHRYFFRLYALDIELPFASGATKTEVLAAMQGHVLAEAELMGRYKRQ